MSRFLICLVGAMLLHNPNAEAAPHRRGPPPAERQEHAEQRTEDQREAMRAAHEAQVQRLQAAQQAAQQRADAAREAAEQAYERQEQMADDRREDAQDWQQHAASLRTSATAAVRTGYPTAARSPQGYR